MSLQWTVVATFLYAEVFLVLLLCVPFVSAARWQKIFKSRLVGLAVAYGNTAFVVLIVILVLLLLDAYRETRKYDASERAALPGTPGALEHFHMRLFRAQRNLYLAGFALLLSLLFRGRGGAYFGLGGPTLILDPPFVIVLQLAAAPGDADLAAGAAGRLQPGLPQAGRGGQPGRPALHGGQRGLEEAAAGGRRRRAGAGREREPEGEGGEAEGGAGGQQTHAGEGGERGAGDAAAGRGADAGVRPAAGPARPPAGSPRRPPG